jgi:hypothetical protein
MNYGFREAYLNILNHVIFPSKIQIYMYPCLWLTVFLLARSNSHDIPFSSILISKKQFLCNKYMLSGCELIDTENISLPSQNMKFVGE